MPAMQLRFDLPCCSTRPAKARAVLAVPPWTHRAVTEPARAPAALWALPAPALDEADVAALGRQIQPGWQRQARCASAEDPEAWFPDPDTPQEDTAAARATCVRCPVRRSCLAQAILGDEDGLWGGLTRRQRRAAVDRLNSEPLDSDRLDSDPDSCGRDWPGLLDALLWRLTTAPVPLTPVTEFAGGSAA